MNQRRAFGLAVLFACVLGATGCALSPQLGKLPLGPVTAQPKLELTETPFFPQEIHQCGPAALATVLNADHVPVTPDALASEIYIPGREGALQAELLAAVRTHQRVAVRLAPRLEALLSPLSEQRPVLLLQNLGLKSLPAWHYAVIVGWDASANEIILRSGSKKRERLSLARFLQTWDLGERWAVVIADPTAPPPIAVTAHDWIAAVAPLEALKQNDRALTAYESAAQRWPGDALVWQALANARYAQRDLSGAEKALDAAVAIDADPAALNNLAQVRIERGCRADALAALDQIAEVPPTLAATIADTRTAAVALPAGSDAVCR
ncbi:MAG: Peptidase like family protein [Hydrocarboniphaga sp.]|uniref:PA2778 family cysteine peptidase n=1 Tax=Hydrocarboniphaga sp. TaxID=2033016 RepID=UPI002635891A|nr:PA2778 family cysteine peptidase [Hydrocarboniphaga sp.]MDB5968909.1 Peptidase like family protein [Hydrocarboniphaga sp.]